MSPKNVLVITPQYAPDLGPSAPIYTALCEDLVHEGYNVTVICGFPHYGRDTHAPEYRGRLFNFENRNGVRIIRFYVYLHRGKIQRRIIYHVAYNLFATLISICLHSFDVVIADAPALWSGLPILTRAIWTKEPYIYVVHDIYPDVAVRLGILQNRQLIKLIDRMEAYFYKHAGFITVLSEGFKENLCRKGVPVDKTVVIPACTDVEFIQPLHGTNKLRAQWKLDNKFVVLYTANIGLPQGLDNVVRAAQLLLQYPDIAIVFVGEGAAKAELQNMVKEMRLLNVHFFPLQPREDVPLVFGLADVSLVSLKREIAMESVPSKTYSIMASGRAVIATVSEDTEIANLISQTECGLVVQPDDPDALASAILELYHNAPLREVMAQKGRDYVVEHFSRTVAFNKYHSIILHLVNGHSPVPANL